MELSTSSSSGYSSMVNSLVSPVNEYNGRLSGIDEEQGQLLDVGLFSKEPVRSFTVPETLNHSTVNENFSSNVIIPKFIPHEQNYEVLSCSNHLFNDCDNEKSAGQVGIRKQ
uniref:Uncharacterized protein n=2 Tax=Panagrolaimus sp. JU765 TaxID=591449 RepID=A0AC34QYW1_9BILA